MAAASLNIQTDHAVYLHRYSYYLTHTKIMWWSRCSKFEYTWFYYKWRIFAYYLAVILIALFSRHWLSQFQKHFWEESLFRTAIRSQISIFSPNGPKNQTQEINQELGQRSGSEGFRFLSSVFDPLQASHLSLHSQVSVPFEHLAKWAPPGWPAGQWQVWTCHTQTHTACLNSYLRLLSSATLHREIADTPLEAVICSK